MRKALILPLVLFMIACLTAPTVRSLDRTLPSVVGLPQEISLQAKITPLAAKRFKARLNTKAKKEQFRRFVHLLLLRAYLDAVWHAIYDIPPDLIPVANCVKGVESGNYSESTHPGSGSGAYQYVPSTWQHWFSLWATTTGYKSSHSLAYLAPWYVQDATFVYTLRHGGASNWSNAYGYDPCTSGM